MTERPRAIWTAAVIAACLCSAFGQSAEPYAGKVFLGLNVRPVKLASDLRLESTYGLLVTRVAALSAADKATLRVGDVLLAVNDQTWSGPKIQFSRLLYKEGTDPRPGRSFALRVFRPDGPPPVKTGKRMSLELILTRYPRTRPELPHTPTNDELRPDLKDVHPLHERLCWKLIREVKLEADCADLLARLRRCEQFPDPDRLAVVRYVHRDPFKVGRVAREITAPVLEAPGRGAADLGLFLDQAERTLLRFDRRVASPAAAAASMPALPQYKGKSLNEHLDYVEAVLKAAAERNKEALRSLTKDEVKHVLDHRAGMVESFIRFKMLTYDNDQSRQRASAKVMDLAGKVDLALLVLQSRLASLLVGPEFTSSLRAAAKASVKDLSRSAIAHRNTPHGAILVAGTGRNVHAHGDIAALYDLGGDDQYRNNQGSSVPGSIPTAVLVDYDGDDTYETTRLWTQGSGNLGVGFLVDLAGGDTYVGIRMAQGASFAGVGVLIDEAGDDVYRAIDLAQGVGHWGVGILIDRAGSDRYEAHLASQAVGLPGGFGMLYDGGGADSYYCKGKQPSGYGTKGIFEGWGQGMGMGYRHYASGGVGVLIDAAGADTFEAGNFSQGGGYFYGFGLLHSAGDNDDRYVGSRYAQGFGCHQAIGALIDDGGSDTYTTRYGGVAQGFSWDEAVGLFIDEAGNDRYEGGHLCQGSAAMNGWSIFVDRAGRDEYLFGEQAHAGGNQYHGGTSLSFFLDMGGADDRYSAKPNSGIVTGREHFIFVDLPASIADALRGDAFRKLIRPKTQRKAGR